MALPGHQPNANEFYFRALLRRAEGDIQEVRERWASRQGELEAIDSGGEHPEAQFKALRKPGRSCARPGTWHHQRSGRSGSAAGGSCSFNSRCWSLNYPYAPSQKPY